MKKTILTTLSISAVVGSMGWTLASHSETSSGLQDISLIQNSEHSHPGPALAGRGFRIRFSPSDYGSEIVKTAHPVPQISVIAE